MVIEDLVVVGIDSAKDRLDAVALLDDRLVGQLSVEVGKRNRINRGESLKDLKLELMTWIGDEIGRIGPVVVYVEEAIMVRSVRVAILLAETVGMILALPYPVFAVPIDSWKKELAKAGLSKDEVREVISGRYPLAARSFGNRQDLFDAFGVALYGYSDQVLRRGLESSETGDSLGSSLA